MGEAGGENMEMDSIQKVAGAEQESQERREAAAAESRRTVAEARKAAEELLEEARRLAAAPPSARPHRRIPALLYAAMGAASVGLAWLSCVLIF